MQLSIPFLSNVIRNERLPGDFVATLYTAVIALRNGDKKMSLYSEKNTYDIVNIQNKKKDAFVSSISYVNVNIEHIVIDISIDRWNLEFDDVWIIERNQ